MIILTLSTRIDDCCPMTKCKNGCGAIFHACKDEDHLDICTNAMIACPYSGYGCSKEIKRKDLLHHLESHQGKTLFECHEHYMIFEYDVI